MTLPDTKQSRETLSVTPLNARVMLAGMPGAGKSTLAAAWAPDTTLIIDTQRGTTLLDGEHFVQHVANWTEFAETVNELTTTDHQFTTVVVDMVDDVWKFIDQHVGSQQARKGEVLASAMDDYQKAIGQAEGMFRQTVGALIASDLGIWFTSHTREYQDGNVTRYRSKLDNRVLTYIQGACQFVFLAETLGTKRVMHTAPSMKFEAKSRVPLPEPMDLDARKLYAAMAKGLKPKTATAPTAPQVAEPEAAATDEQAETREAVTA